MKKIILVLSALLSITVLTSCDLDNIMPAQEEDEDFGSTWSGVTDDGFYYSIQKETKETMIYKYNNGLKNIVCPSFVIHDDVQYDIEKLIGMANLDLESVEIPEGIERIGYRGFSENKLKHIKISNSVIKIESYAFQDNELETIELGTGLEIIEYEAFQNNKITSVIIPSGVKKIEKDAFTNNNITSVIIPASVEELSDEAFDADVEIIREEA